ncbi:MAG: hypothetical protein AAF443_02795, partial [Chlamydiota bacterium]
VSFDEFSARMNFKEDIEHIIKYEGEVEAKPCYKHDKINTEDLKAEIKELNDKIEAFKGKSEENIQGKESLKQEIALLTTKCCNNGNGFFLSKIAKLT